MDGGTELPDIEFDDPPAKKRTVKELVKLIVMIVVLSYLILWFAIYFFHTFRDPIREFFDNLIRQLIF